MPDPLRDALLAKLRGLWDEPTPRQKMSLPNVEAMNLPGPDGDLPVIVPHPPQFQPAPQVVGQDLGRSVNDALKIAPSLQGRVGHVQYGTTPDVMNDIDESNKLVMKRGDGRIFDPISDFPNTNLLGLTNMRTGNISLSPRLDQHLYRDEFTASPTKVLGHEMTHAAGYPDEKTPDTGGDLFQQLMSRSK